jgi:hypothetical protein
MDADASTGSGAGAVLSDASESVDEWDARRDADVCAYNSTVHGHACVPVPYCADDVGQSNDAESESSNAASNGQRADEREWRNNRRNIHDRRGLVANAWDHIIAIHGV